VKKSWSRAAVSGGGLLVIATAAIGLAGPDLRPGVWYLLIAVGTALVALPLTPWFEYPGAKRSRRRHEDARTQNLVAVGPLAADDETDETDDGFDDRYPEHTKVLTLLRQAIRDDCEVRFRYQREGGDDRHRVARPRYLHERASRSTGESVLCLNAYYPRRRRTLDFSLRRMRDVELAD